MQVFFMLAETMLAAGLLWHQCVTRRLGLAVFKQSTGTVGCYSVANEYVILKAFGATPRIYIQLYSPTRFLPTRFPCSRSPSAG